MLRISTVVHDLAFSIAKKGEKQRKEYWKQYGQRV